MTGISRTDADEALRLWQKAGRPADVDQLFMPRSLHPFRPLSTPPAAASPDRLWARQSEQAASLRRRRYDADIAIHRARAEARGRMIERLAIALIGLLLVAVAAQLVVPISHSPASPPLPARLGPPERHPPVSSRVPPRTPIRGGVHLQKAGA